MDHTTRDSMTAELGALLAKEAGLRATAADLAQRTDIGDPRNAHSLLAAVLQTTLLEADRIALRCTALRRAIDGANRQLAEEANARIDAAIRVALGRWTASRFPERGPAARGAA